MLDLCDIAAEPDQWVPSGLDEIPPGPKLAAVLSVIDVRRISGYDRPSEGEVGGPYCGFPTSPSAVAH